MAYLAYLWRAQQSGRQARHAMTRARRILTVRRWYGTPFEHAARKIIRAVFLGDPIPAAEWEAALYAARVVDASALYLVV